MANRRKTLATQARAKAQPETERIAQYTRVSSDGQSKEMTIDRQVGVVTELFDRFYGGDSRAQLVGLYKDEGYNLEEIDETRHFWRIIKMIQAGLVNVLIVASEDRVFRGESAALRGLITDVFRHNRVKLITSSGVLAYDPTETSSRVATSVTQELGAISKLEAMKTMHDGRRRKAEKGDWYLNVTPFGMRCTRYMEGRVKKYTYTIVEDEAQYVRDVYRLYAGLKPLVLPAPETGGRIGATKIARILEDFGVSRELYVQNMPSSVATLGWDRQKVLRMLTNETYTGRLIINFNPTKKVSGFDRVRTVKTIDVPAIIDDSLFAKVQETYQKKRDSMLDDWQPRTETNWLHGLIRCPVCDKKLFGRLAGNIGADRYYGCGNFHGKLYRCDDVEREVENYLNTTLLNEKNFNKLMELANKRLSKADDRKKLEKIVEKKSSDKAGLESKLDVLLEKLISGIITDSQFNRFKEKLELDLKQVNEEIGNLETSMRALSVAKTSIDSFLEIKDAIANAIKNPEKKEKIYRLAANSLIREVRLNEHKLEISGLTNDEIKEYFHAGYFTLKDLRAHFGWCAKKVYSIFGQNHRRSRIDYKVEVALKM